MPMKTVNETCPTCMGSRRAYVAGGLGTCYGCSGTGRITRTVHVPDPKVPNRGVKDAGAEAPDLGKRVANFIAIPSGIAVFIFTFSLVQNNTLSIAAIVAAVVYAALYWTLSRPLYGLSSGIGAVVSTAFEILGLVLRVAIYLVGAGVIVWIAWALLR